MQRIFDFVCWKGEFMFRLCQGVFVVRFYVVVIVLNDLLIVSVVEVNMVVVWVNIWVVNSLVIDSGVICSIV